MGALDHDLPKRLTSSRKRKGAHGAGSCDDRHRHSKKLRPGARQRRIHSDRERQLEPGEDGEFLGDLGDRILAHTHLVDKRLLQFGRHFGQEGEHATIVGVG